MNEGHSLVEAPGVDDDIGLNRTTQDFSSGRRSGI